MINWDNKNSQGFLTNNLENLTLEDCNKLRDKKENVLKTKATPEIKDNLGIINAHRQSLSKRAKKLFNKQTGRLRGPDEINGNIKVVEQLERMGFKDSKDLFEMMANINVDSSRVKLTTSGFKGMLIVNKNLVIHPLKLLQIPAGVQQDIFEFTKNYAERSITKEEFNEKMDGYCREHRINFESTREETRQKLCQMYGEKNIQDIVLGSKKIFAHAKPNEIDSLTGVFRNTLKDNSTIIEMARSFVNTRNFGTIDEFIALIEYFVWALNRGSKDDRARYKKDLAEAKTQSNFAQKEFGKARVKFLQQIWFDHSKNENFAELNKFYDEQKAIVAPLNQKCSVSFFSNDSATYHYLKHSYFKNMYITAAGYFKIAEEVVGNPKNIASSTWSQEGDCKRIVYIEPRRGVLCVKFVRPERSIIGTMLFDRKIQNSNCKGNLPLLPSPMILKKKKRRKRKKKSKGIENQDTSNF